jgi:hypothetical protein
MRLVTPAPAPEPAPAPAPAAAAVPAITGAPPAAPTAVPAAAGTAGRVPIVDIDAVTGEVLRRIERRAIAQRERMGRVSV